MQEHRYERADLEPLSAFWEAQVMQAIDKMPEEWIEAIEITNLKQEQDEV